ncbi:hypothetical protein ACO229_06520 [Promicromonospora sp. MS192]|uniref:hypothetical protein n=1 Tax=Promicromonospora sp. MS192 TaxID=3412684 RepID=UPI003C2EA461
MDSSNPQHDAEDAAEALRRLAHSTRTFDDPSDTYWVLTDLAAVIRRLEQVITQVQAAHRDHLDLAHDDQGGTPAGRTNALAAVEHLGKTGELFGLAYASLDLAMSHSGSIAWYPATTGGGSGGRRPRAQARHARHETTTDVRPSARPAERAGRRSR